MNASNGRFSHERLREFVQRQIKTMQCNQAIHLSNRLSGFKVHIYKRKKAVIRQPNKEKNNYRANLSLTEADIDAGCSLQPFLYLYS